MTPAARLSDLNAPWHGSVMLMRSACLALVVVAASSALAQEVPAVPVAVPAPAVAPAAPVAAPVAAAPVPAPVPVPPAPAPATPAPTTTVAPAAPAPAPTPPAREETITGYRTHAGQWTIAGGVLGNYTATANEVPGVGSAPASTFFLRVTPTLGWFVIDNLEVRGSAGLLSRQLFRANDKAALENDLALELGVRWMIPLNERFNLHLDAGLGGYVGSSDRDSVIGGEDVVEKTSTWGGLLTVSGGAGYLLVRNFELGVDVKGTGLAGFELIKTEDNALFASTFNGGMELSLTYYF